MMMMMCVCVFVCVFVCVRVVFVYTSNVRVALRVVKAREEMCVDKEREEGT